MMMITIMITYYDIIIMIVMIAIIIVMMIPTPILITESGISMCSIAVFENVYGPRSERVLERITFFNWLQLAKAWLMLLTESGMTIVSIDEYEKALLLIVCKEDGNVTFFML